MVNSRRLRRKRLGKDPNIDYLVGAAVLITNIFEAKVLLQSLGCCHL